MADLVSNDDARSWLVTGFFTPDYRPLAAALAASLDHDKQPYHLFAVDKSGDWSSQTMRKPSIVIGALDAHPGKTVILMDVDCTVHGPLDALASFCPAADVCCLSTARSKKIGRHRQRFSLSSRVMVVRPTPGARALMQQWDKACRERPWMHGDEPNLTYALTCSPGSAYSTIPLIYSGREASEAPAGSIITHESAAKAFGTGSTKLNSLLKLLKR
jgi:hypothetical protein